MPAEFYSPNAKGMGAALFVSFNSKDGSIFFKFTKQTSWNDQTKKGGFKGGASLNFKLSQDEAGEILRAIRTDGSTSFYHSFGDDKTTGNFNHYVSKQTNKQGFGLGVKRGSDEFKVGFSLGSAERLAEYLRFALDHIFSAIYANDKKEFEEYCKQKGSPKTFNKPTEQPAKAAVAEVVEEDEVDF